MLSYQDNSTSMYPSVEELADLVATIRMRMGAFLFVFFLIFTLSYLMLYSFGLVPKTLETNGATPEATAMAAAVATTSAEEVPVVPAAPEHVLPVSITIDALDRTLPVHNPDSRAIADLDTALLKGVVRHPDSADFAAEGTMFILGHSSYLPTVHNQFFKAFNGIQKLTWGDTIRVRSVDTEYVYQVENVYQAKASEVVVPIANTGARLTLATCDSFGSKDDRYIVEARFLYSEPITATQ